MTRAWIWIGALALIASNSATAAEPITISQKGKHFTPDRIEIPVGTSVQIVNDDRVLHHLYIETPEFNYDSGEQEPGQRSSINFSKRGTFEVKCDIHPKMLLRVIVH